VDSKRDAWFDGPTLRDVIADPKRDDPFLITLLHRLRSEPIAGGIYLTTELSDEAPAIVDDAGKARLFAVVEGIDREPIVLWKRRARSGEVAEYWNDRLPLRWASGGVLAIVVHRGKENFALSFRNIYPKGWNLFVGASGSWDDLVDVERTAEREFREESLIHNKAENVIYGFELPEQRFGPRDFQDEALARWGLTGCARQPLACEIIRGPDRVIVVPSRDGEALPARTTDGLFLVIDPRALGIECMRIVRIPLPDALDLERDVAFLDGELHGDGLLDSAIGLLDVTEYDRWRRRGARGDLPFAHIYQGGKRLSRGMADSKQIKGVWEYRNAFCPVTEEMVRRS
jgi:hypothetical protein